MTKTSARLEKQSVRCSSSPAVATVEKSTAWLATHVVGSAPRHVPRWPVPLTTRCRCRCLLSKDIVYSRRQRSASPLSRGSPMTFEPSMECWASCDAPATATSNEQDADCSRTYSVTMRRPIADRYIIQESQAYNTQQATDSSPTAWVRGRG